MIKALSLAALVGVAPVPLAANAHHSYSEYDDTKSVEVEGKLVALRGRTHTLEYSSSPSMRPVRSWRKKT